MAGHAELVHCPHEDDHSEDYREGGLQVFVFRIVVQ
jgi:hypothetical protein